MNELFSNLGLLLMSLILVESVIYVTGLWFVSYLSKKNNDDSNNFHG